MSIGKAIKIVMQEKSISALELAKMRGCNRGTIKAQIGDGSNPSWSTVEEYAKLLGVTSAYIAEAKARIDGHGVKNEK